MYKVHIAFQYSLPISKNLQRSLDFQVNLQRTKCFSQRKGKFFANIISKDIAKPFSLPLYYFSFYLYAQLIRALTLCS